MKRTIVDAGYFGMWLRCTGRTNLVSRVGVYPPQPNMGGGSTGLYRLGRRSFSECLAVNGILRNLSKGKHAYLITHTMAPEHDHYARRDAWRMFVDRFRKIPQVYAYQWMTEIHKGEHGEGENLGTIHHHMVALMTSRWEYTKANRIVDWSQRYSGSVNGLDVKALSNGVGYIVHGLAYAVKDAGSADELPFRWWGCSAIKREAMVYGPIAGCMVTNHYNGQESLRVSYADAARVCADATRDALNERKRIRIQKARGIRWPKRRQKYNEVWAAAWPVEPYTEEWYIARAVKLPTA